MTKFKIIISPAKTFNKDAEWFESGIRPKYILDAKDIFGKIKELTKKETKEIYKLSDKKTQEVFLMHKEHGKKLYHAIELYNGLVYKQLKISDEDKEWVNDHIVILDALYGIIKPYDLIAPYRLDFKTDIGIDLNKFWKSKINKELEGYEIINLASKEFSGLVDHDLKTLTLPQGQIKKARGILLNKIITTKKLK